VSGQVIASVNRPNAISVIATHDAASENAKAATIDSRKAPTARPPGRAREKGRILEFTMFMSDSQ
jgi:hypothetical protein